MENAPSEQQKQPPRYIVKWAPATKKQIRRIDRKEQVRVIADGDALAENPRPAGVDRKSGPWAAYYSIKVGIHFRIAYTIDDQIREVVIAKVGPRENFWQRPPGG